MLQELVNAGCDQVGTDLHLPLRAGEWIARFWQSESSSSSNWRFWIINTQVFLHKNPRPFHASLICSLPFLKSLAAFPFQHDPEGSELSWNCTIYTLCSVLCVHVCYC
jgi:hypothetical protein